MSSNEFKTMKGSVTFVPIFVFKGIDPKAITKKYFEGKYNDSEIPSTQIKLRDVFHVTTPSYGTSPEEPRYQFRDKNNASVVVVTTNSKEYDLYKRAKQFDDKERVCPWCLRKYDCEPSLVATRHKQKEIKGSVYDFFWTTNVFCCSPSCALAWHKRETGCDPLFKATYKDTELMYRLMFPGKRIRQAPQWRLLETNEGSMTEEEFDKNKYVYERTSNIITLPSKEEYIQSQLT